MLNIASSLFDNLESIWIKFILNLYVTDEKFVDSIPEDIILSKKNDSRLDSEHVQDYLVDMAKTTINRCRPIYLHNTIKDTDTHIYQYMTNLPRTCFHVLKKYEKNNIIFPWTTEEELGKMFIKFYESRDFDNDFIEKLLYDKKTILISLRVSFMLSELNTLSIKSFQMATSTPETIVVDFSSPNMAKKMHLGHIRSTIIGDVISRLFEFKGHIVHRINHLGDWGRPFAIVITYLLDHYQIFKDDPTAETLQKFYTLGTNQFKSDTLFEKKVYDNLKKLQEKDPKIYGLWKTICTISRDAYQQIYNAFGIKLTDMGESFYQDKMENMIYELEQKGYLRKLNGMSVINVDKIPNPFILKKSDGKGGNYTYDTSDLAALKYRIQNMKADRIYYVVDTGQSNHFDLLFGSAKQVEYYDPSKTIIKHINFGLVQSSGGGKLSARKQTNPDEDTSDLQDIINKGKKMALEYTKKNNESRTVDINLSQSEILDIATTLNYNCLKYFELSHKRTANYKVDHNKLFNPTGNTAIYINYAYARCYQIWNKFKQRYSDFEISDISRCSDIELYENTYKPEPSEIKLLSHLLTFPEVIELMEKGTSENTILMPHHLTDYIYNLATLFARFYKSPNCYCLNSKDTNEYTIVYYNRMLLIVMILKVMDTIFNLLGIIPLTKI